MTVYTVTWTPLKDSDMPEAGWGMGCGWFWHLGLAVVSPVWAGLFTVLESFLPSHGAQLIQQACDPEQQAGLQDE